METEESIIQKLLWKRSGFHTSVEACALSYRITHITIIIGISFFLSADQFPWLLEILFE